ncbi:MAG: CarD family transcriptional regulator [Desulfobulbaceae bacterium]|nr:CarD family transcriptional regulator [Desulfobulbaceae bacterium]
MFKKGDMAVYPGHGVGKIKKIETQVVAGEEHSFYVMEVRDTSMTVMIPCLTSEKVGLRAIITTDDVDEVFTILNMKDVEIVAQPWNQRYREYMEKIKSGSVFEIASVLRDLFVLTETKDLSFGERKMLDSARILLVSEISLANSMSEDEVGEQIEGIFA